MKCQNCNNEFNIEERDKAFYKKLKVPSPTFCPECRMIRRMVWRNDRTLCKRKCEAPGHTEELISMYSPDKAVTIYDKEYWWSDEWDALDYAREYDFNKPFFEQFKDLQAKVPRPPLVNNKAVNSEYCNFADENKNCYLVLCANRNEDSCYSTIIIDSKDMGDCFWCTESERLYQCIDCQECYKLVYAKDCKNCMESSFLLDCRNCNNCLFCVGLRDKSYYIFNKPSTKEEYENMIKELSGDHAKYEQALKKFEHIKKEYPMRRANNFVACTNVIGDFIFQSRNINQGFDTYDSEDCSYVQEGLGAKECTDVSFFDKLEFCYESISIGLPAFMCAFTVFCRESNNLLYCDNCHSCNDCFGCVSLRKKQYCILNKQYTKEQYNEMISKIKEHMNSMPYTDKKGRAYAYGEFFPIELNPLAYNETNAQEYFPLTKEQSLEQGYGWRDLKQRDIYPTMKTQDIPNNIKDVKDDITKEIIQCEHQGKCNAQCTEAFKIVPQELNYYRKMDLPLPRLCPNCRHYIRLKQRNPLKLWKRKCDKCNIDIQTTYAPDREETIYCQDCYKKEVI